MGRYFKDGRGTASMGVKTSFLGERQFFQGGQRFREEHYYHTRVHEIDLFTHRIEAWAEVVRLEMEPARADEPRGVA
jgi:hypothetical protein